jgi:hypothetical protein
MIQFYKNPPFPFLLSSHIMASWESEVTARDTGAEWLIKGANIGMYFGAVFSYYEVLPGPWYAARYLGNVAGTMAVTGGALGTWMFVSKGIANQRGSEDFINYGIGAGTSFAIWHRAFGVATTVKLIPMTGLAAVWGGLLGSYFLVREGGM